MLSTKPTSTMDVLTCRRIDNTAQPLSRSFHVQKAPLAVRLHLPFLKK